MENDNTIEILPPPEMLDLNNFACIWWGIEILDKSSAVKAMRLLLL